MHNYLECPICNYDCVELITTITIDTTDHYSTTKIKIDGDESLELSMRYDYRSRGNIHLIFQGEGCGHWFIKSFDGHKGMMYCDENSLMNSLQDYLNEMEKKNEYLTTYSDFIKNCKRFFVERAKAEKEREKQNNKVVYLKNKNNNLSIF